jgi:hypothetical protein
MAECAMPDFPGTDLFDDLQAECERTERLVRLLREASAGARRGLVSSRVSAAVDSSS